MNDRTSHVCNNASNEEEIAQYLQDLALLPVVSLKAEQNAVQQIAQAPDSAEAVAARTLLIEAHLRLVVRLARCYQPFGPELADLVQEGNLALTRAAHQFDPQRKQRFGPFAARAVRWALSRVVTKHLREMHLLEADSERETLSPLSTQVHTALIRHAIDEQAVVFDLPEDRFISLDRLLEETDTDACLSDDRSTDAMYCCDESGEWHPDQCAIVQEQRVIIAACLHLLTPRERLVLTRRFLVDRPQTLEEIGRALSVTRELIRLTEQRGLRKLRHPRASEILRSLL
jgi:RNA polymerase primary sigma factor